MSNICFPQYLKWAVADYEVGGSCAPFNPFSQAFERQRHGRPSPLPPLPLPSRPLFLTLIQGQRAQGFPLGTGQPP